jgi:hypothetical protein
MFSFRSFHFIFEDKTNHGQTLYGRATRHKDVSLCSVCALAFYLMFPFSVTREFENSTLEDWMENSKWFDIKMLVNLQGFGDGKFTVMNFLSFMMTLNRLFIPDAAAMLVLFPERINHPLFWLEVFGSKEFHVSFIVALL